MRPYNISAGLLSLRRVLSLEDRCLKQTALLNPVRASHIAISVPGEVPGEGAFRALLSARQDSSNTRANRTFAHNEAAFAGDKRFVAHLDACDIGDSVQGSGVPSKGTPRSRARVSALLRTIGAAVMAGPATPLVPVWAVSASDPIFSTQYTAIKRTRITNILRVSSNGEHRLPEPHSGRMTATRKLCPTRDFHTNVSQKSSCRKRPGGHFREARLNEAASRQTLSRVRWRQCG
jgi:hypothetical protein